MKPLTENSFFKEVIQSPDFQRLKGISFLGILDYCFESKSYSTRYDHSLAVANLCSEYLLRKNISETEKKYFVLAGLLHDIGHCGFSHSLEPVFEEKFSITHHDITKEIITDSPYLAKTWVKHNIDPSRIIDTIEGLSNSRDKVIAQMPINFDTLDGIARTEKRFSTSNRANLISAQTFNVLCEKDDWSNQLRQFDSFWEQKGRIYGSFIYNDKAQTIELCFQNLFRNETTLYKEDFLLTEPELFEKFAWLRTFTTGINNRTDEFIRSKSEDNLDCTIKTSIRNFFVNSDGDFSPHKNDRYLTSIEEKGYSFKDNYAFAIFRRVL
ncbi:MAG: HD superfamily metal-dependent phosphohydrolase [Nitrospirae bacterium]|nr:MAG: HD superfamily metal-dependent phosphohydrolase [Nitrospirota bacterium]